MPGMLTGAKNPHFGTLYAPGVDLSLLFWSMAMVSNYLINPYFYTNRLVKLSDLVKLFFVSKYYLVQKKLTGQGAENKLLWNALLQMVQLLYPSRFMEYCLRGSQKDFEDPEVKEDSCTHELTAALVAYSRTLQDYLSEHCSMGWGGAHKPVPLI